MSSHQLSLQYLKLRLITNKITQKQKIQVLANKDGKSAGAVERIECPICTMDITNFDVCRRSSHINACIERNEGTDAAKGSDSQSDTSIALPTSAQDTTNDLKIALELQKEENNAQTPNICMRHL